MFTAGLEIASSAGFSTTGLDQVETVIKHDWLTTIFFK